MKIDFISNSIAGGGAERVMVLLANEFINRNYDISIITLNTGQSYDVSSQINRVKLHGGNIKNHTIRRLLQLNKYYNKKENRPDIIISFLPPISLVAIPVAKLYKIKIICSEHTNHLNFGNYVTKFTRNYLYQFSDYVTILTSFDKLFYEKKGAKVQILPNPCTFSPLQKSKSDSEKIILAIGDLNRYHIKGFDNLINLISPILKEHSDWQLKIIGSGNEGLKFLNTMVIKNKMSHQIQFAGFRSDIDLIMQESEIFVLSSRVEGLPMVLLEAMSQGMACIAYDCKTGPSDIITNNQNGLLIKDQDMVAMQNGLETLINDQTLRRKLASNGIKSLENYSMDSIMLKWEQLFAKVLNS
ncbi:glycosyltransferase family 4 protein [Sediminicola arcticus]|uniref:Glycosyltransferase family 4 protein n=1 Tax=Sediminicola arcticus TaxID=1574308 RepID=A0ABV2SV29_9FLAO